MKPVRATRLCIFALLVLSVTGCGYELVREKGVFGGAITTLSLPIFKNITYEPHVSLYVTDAFSQELMGTGLFKLGREGTDGYLEGTVRDIRIVPNALSGTGLTIQKTIYMDLDLSLFGKDTKVIRRWTFSDNEVYRTDDINIEDYNKRDALRKISARMARRFSAAILVDY
jgi:hypothetical protein